MLTRMSRDSHVLLLRCCYMGLIVMLLLVTTMQATSVVVKTLTVLSLVVDTGSWIILELWHFSTELRIPPGTTKPYVMTLRDYLLSFLAMLIVTCSAAATTTSLHTTPVYVVITVFVYCFVTVSSISVGVMTINPYELNVKKCDLSGSSDDVSDDIGIRRNNALFENDISKEHTKLVIESDE